ncbi:MAG: metallophosphoesterase [Myxococcota bacterium]
MPQTLRVATGFVAKRRGLDLGLIVVAASFSLGNSAEHKAPRSLSDLGHGRDVYCQQDPDSIECRDPVELKASRPGADFGWVGSTVVDRNPGLNHRIGWYRGSRRAYVVRFSVPADAPRRVEFARLRMPAGVSSPWQEPLELSVAGLGFDGAPGQLWERAAISDARRVASIRWTVSKPWPGVAPGERAQCVPFRRYSPDLAAVVNPLLKQIPEGKSGFVTLVVEPIGEAGPDETKFVSVEDSAADNQCWIDHPSTLELYPSLRSTMLGKELLGRITDSSVTVNVHLLTPLELAIQYGRVDSELTATPSRVHANGAEVEIDLSELAPDTRYVYRLAYRRPGEPSFRLGPLRTFRTRRSRGAAFTFAIQSDPHLQQLLRRFPRGLRTYERGLDHMLESRPDFMLDLGDTFQTQWFGGRDARDQAESMHRHLDHRRFFDRIAHSVPLFLALGNHEGEQGWRRNGTPESVPVWATRARKILYPNPRPNDFFSAPNDPQPHVGLRESTYAFTWGAALFVILDPFWYTAKNPHPPIGRDDPWRWTLGESQYVWLARVLKESDARFKFVFAHHMTGGLRYPNAYGRGGARAVKHALGGQGSYEWGGEDASGRQGFERARPGWKKPIHQLLVDSNVTAFFRGHDHCFAHEEVDHVTYQTVPMAADPSFSRGACDADHFQPGAVRPNPGYLRVQVSDTEVQVAYVRIPFSARQAPKEVATYTLVDCDQNGVLDSKQIGLAKGLDADRDGELDICRAQAKAND